MNAFNFYAFSAHKLYGTTGIGALYGKAELLEEMSPWQGSSKILTKVDFNGLPRSPLPSVSKPAPPNTASLVELSAAFSWLEQHD